MDIKDRLWSLMARSLSGEATSDELKELYTFLESDEDLQLKYELFSRYWKKENEPENQESTDQDEINRIMNRAEAVNQEYLELFPSQDRRKTRKRLFYGLAAVSIAVLGYFLIFGINSKSVVPEKASKVISAQNGSQSKTILPDGSVVRLNAGSKLIYDENFSGEVREVGLEGEAYFEVVKAGKPFIVHAHGIDIKVLGTSFNVKSYPEDESVETTLLQGAVEVINKNTPNAKSIFLKPNQKITLRKIEPLIKTSEPRSFKQEKAVLMTDSKIVSLDPTIKNNERFETAWIFNRLIFRGDNFEEIGKKLERWYNVQILFGDEKVKQLRFNGSFETETVEEALTALRIAKQFNFKTNNNEILITSAE